MSETGAEPVRRGRGRPCKGDRAQTGTERKAAHRDRQRALGASGKLPTKFDQLNFVAVDGEGFTLPGARSRVVTIAGETCEVMDQHYALLAASGMDELRAPYGERLKLHECFDYLIKAQRQHDPACLVVYGGSYDMVQMLAHDLSREQLKELTARISAGRTRYYANGHTYLIKWRHRKFLEVMRCKGKRIKWERAEKPRPGYEYTIAHNGKFVLWDVIGFFQTSFVETIGKWLSPDEHGADLALIREWKQRRDDFNFDDFDAIAAYNQAELRCLVALMNEFRKALLHPALSLRLTSWHGAGAIASKLYRKHKTKEHRRMTHLSDPDVFEAAQCAYSGGHIEAPKVGHTDAPVWNYDINSAYPYWIAQLPSLADGRWIHGTGTPPDGFTIVHSEWRFPDKLPFYPLFHRDDIERCIRYPRYGRGWHWVNEFNAAREFQILFGGSLDVLEWWHWENYNPEARPFAWVQECYDLRAGWKRAAFGTMEYGAEKIIKLGLNSLYGKMIQAVGALEGINGEILPPTNYQLEWSGFVTAGCRSQVMRAAMQRPHDIVMFATDGVTSLAPLSVELGKGLGQWEAEHHAGCTLAMPGIYWFYDQDGKQINKTRGWNKEEMATDALVMEAWRTGKEQIKVSAKVFIGIGHAGMGDAYYENRGCWLRYHKVMDIASKDNKKRDILDIKRQKPHKRMVALKPRTISDCLFGEEACESAPYPVRWLDHDFEAEREYYEDMLSNDDLGSDELGETCEDM